MAKTRKNRLSPEAIAKRGMKANSTMYQEPCVKMAAEASAAQKEYILKRRIEDVKKIIKMQGYEKVVDQLRLGEMMLRMKKKYAKPTKMTRRQKNKISCVYDKKTATYRNHWKR